MRNYALGGGATATLLLASAYAVNGGLVWALVITALGLLWLIGQWRSWSARSSVGLIGFAAAAAFGTWLGLPPGWMLLSTVAALVTWDLDDFSLRLQSAVEGELQLRRWHFQRLLITVSLGLLLGGIALSIQVELTFWWALLLGLLAIFCLSWAFRMMRSQGD
ncbi:MAG: hypothetical protein A2Z21_03845 [Candidatus Fraserbacteria bacterium RBG_16_55_9]|uniref:Uncharacterized protein n=1 Tax=Fraserbacteria sp. (strain RBG_16_55_9) TaxID=1817864 RepID=A0A1F5UX90_FRAXR|nr:MAG: hypothetical protein A2Z21_03845 [Candidatus Fraserbacteria bacterium RBG_16_55_9]